MIISGSTNTIWYYSRYNRVDKYEIYDHTTKLVSSGLTHFVGYDGKIEHSGLTYNFNTNNYYTYKAFYTENSGATYYLANQTLLQSIYTEVPFFVENVKTKNTYKIRN